jgi:hypothetical protein
LIVAKFNSRHIKKKVFSRFFQPFPPRLPSKFVKSAVMKEKISQMQCGYQKTQNFMLIPNPLKKLKKSFAKKLSTKK